MKIKIVHLLLNDGDRGDISQDNWDKFLNKQNRSIEYFLKVSKKFIKYTQIYNQRFIGPPPIDTCNVPECYVADPNFAPTDGRPWVSSGHYGAFESHKDAILNEFSSDLDGILIVEGDVVGSVEPEEFIDRIYKSISFGEDQQASMITFANVLFGGGSDAHNNIISYGEYDKIDHFLCCNCYMILKSERNNIQNKLKDAKWMAFDIWLYWNYDKRVPIFKTHMPISYETQGFSFIDFKTKDANYLP